MSESSATPLARRLGTFDAVIIGLGSMIGAGLFVVFTPAAAAAGSLLFVALGVAACVAYCNATSTARLAAVHPASGGTYVYGTRQLGPLWGYLAGWSFITGKTASCAAMALTVAHYLLPDAWSSYSGPVAALVVVAITALNLCGIQKSALATRAIVGFVLISLAIELVIGWVSPRTGDFGWTMYQPLTDASQAHAQGIRTWPMDEWKSVPFNPGVYEVLQAAGLLFFAFAGYARIATLGEEVKDPARTIPRAIPIALGITLLVYCAVAYVLMQQLGLSLIANVDEPLRELADHTGETWLIILVSVTAVAAATCSLLTMILGVSRTGLAMARDGHLPRQLAAVDAKRGVPRAMELTVAVVVIAAVLLTDVVTVIGFSSFGVLLYYSIANISAMTLTNAQRRPFVLVPILGLIGCVALAASVPWTSLIAGITVTVLGLAVYGIVLLTKTRTSQADIN
ncbi:APC family permease [Corynebacterium suicordis]|uniref:Amino acid permease n=1 Tax=Corynebacterium suicordis DSM 45110 TaxID=1121369 RepID=A0ABR9ZLQ6_9CORY|nr:amino acid permease [Corynebacterium suicordis]MBF4553884.1 amino acid permease [Corynebacterium suicordis DSM 45110]MDR6277140.1 APA family basic amino acid/polyamine antiporter [Corynebacterium suicordis]